MAPEYNSYSTLKQIDVELATLAALTVAGLKPVSRWERSLGDEALGALTSLGLTYRQIFRSVASGSKICETVFSNTSAWPEVYERLFSEKPIDKSPVTQRWEGFLFGYPPCCVTHYINAPYAPNNLSPEIQEMLFHWACPDCVITPVLVPAYKRILASLQTC